LQTIRSVIQSQYPTIEEMPFCAALRDGRFGRNEILRAEIVELYRALNTRERIQSAYKRKLTGAVDEGAITGGDQNTMVEIINDEGETDEHIDHLDMRFKLFVGTPVSRQSSFRRNDDLEAINTEWMNICDESSLFELMALTAGIEDWYAPLSAFFEQEYRKRGFSDEELELFIVHKEADVDHSDAQFDILERNRAKFDEAKIAGMVKRTFKTSRGYDTVKLKLAETDFELEDLLA